MGEFGGGVLTSALWRVCEARPWGRHEGHPAINECATRFGRTQGSLSDGPGRAGVVEAHGDQAAQVERSGAVVQPMVILGHAAIAEFAVAAHDPGDAAFDHGSVLSVSRLKFRCFGVSAGCEWRRVVL